MKLHTWKGWVGSGVFVLLIAAGVGVYAMVNRDAQVAEAVPAYKEATVKRGAIQIDFKADGMAAFSLLNLRFPVSGTLDALPVSVGDVVKQGDLLAEVDDAALRLKIADAEAAYELASLQREKTILQYEEELKTDAAKIDTLLFQVKESTNQYESMKQAEEAFSRLELENAAASLANAEAVLAAAQSAYARLQGGDPDITLGTFSMEQAEKTIAEAEAALSDTSLIAPVAGKVVMLSAQPGEAVSSSVNFLTLALSDSPDILSQVSELDVASIELGQAVDIEFEALGNEIFSGHVTGVDPLAERDGNGLVNYTVHLALDASNERILDGMTCTVSYILRKKEGIFIIPNSAIRMVDKVQVVEVRDESGIVSEKPVTTGLTDGLNVELVSGLAAGDIVLIRTK